METLVQNADAIFGHATVLAGQLAYLEIPADHLRRFFDGLGGGLAKLPYADSANGMWHRWREGHDLLVDIPRSFASANKSGWSHLGHVLITDFPTKAGIPIPGTSAGGLGHFLTETCGISKGWLSLNIMDTGVGILAISEGSSDLIAAFNGTLSLDAWTFLDTFGEGAIELWLGCQTQNPLLLGAGVENVLAGLVMLKNPLSWQINMTDVLGHSLTGALIGIGITALIYKNESPQVRARHMACNAMRAAAVSGLGALSIWFSLGAATGFILYRIGGKMAETGSGITPESVQQKLRMLCESPQFAKLWDEEQRRIDKLLHEVPELPSFKLPEISPLPEISALPEVSPLPEVSSLPEVSPLPEVSSLPEISPLPKISPLPEVRIP